MAAKRSEYGQPVFDTTISTFHFTLQVTGHLIITSPNHDATVLNPQQVHQLFNGLFIHREYIVDGSKRIQQEQEAQYRPRITRAKVVPSDWMKVRTGEQHT